jgi:hypothetical protein
MRSQCMYSERLSGIKPVLRNCSVACCRSSMAQLPLSNHLIDADTRSAIDGLLRPTRTNYVKETLEYTLQHSRVEIQIFDSSHVFFLD